MANGLEVDPFFHHLNLHLRVSDMVQQCVITFWVTVVGFICAEVITRITVPFATLLLVTLPRQELLWLHSIARMAQRKLAPSFMVTSALATKFVHAVHILGSGYLRFQRWRVSPFFLLFNDAYHDFSAS